MKHPLRSLNFRFLEGTYPELAEIGAIAERYVHVDAAGVLVSLRRLAELMTREYARRLNVNANAEFAEVAKSLERAGGLPAGAQTLINRVRVEGNKAVHGTPSQTGDALPILRLAHELAIWFHRTMGAPNDFDPKPFMVPPTQEDLARQLHEERAIRTNVESELEARNRQLEELELRAKAAEIALESRQVALALSALQVSQNEKRAVDAAEDIRLARAGAPYESGDGRITRGDLIDICDAHGLVHQRQTQWTQVGPTGAVYSGSTDRRVFYIRHSGRDVDLREGSGPPHMIGRLKKLHPPQRPNGQIVARVPLAALTRAEWEELVSFAAPR